MTLRSARFVLVVTLSAGADLGAQSPGFYRGEGQLLPPALRGPDDPDTDMADLTLADYLWAFQREALCERVVPVVLPANVLEQVRAALASAAKDVDPTLCWHALWALARIGRHDAEAAGRVRDRVLGGGLLAAQGPVGDVAAVALGLVAHDDAKALTALAQLATDVAAAPDRRAYAFYGLGLAAQDSRQATVQFRVLGAVERALLRASAAPDQVRIAALHTLALTRLETAPNLPGPALALLEQAWSEEPAPPGSSFDFRAHVPIAVGSMVRPDMPAAEAWRARLAAIATETVGSLQMPRSAVLALGALCRPWHDDDSPDAEYGRLLQRLTKDARDLQLRNYAWFAAGLQRGERQRQFLRKGLTGHFLMRPWAGFGLAALALAVADDPDGVAGDVAALEAAIAVTRSRPHRDELTQALDVVQRGVGADTLSLFLTRYHQPLPGVGEPVERAGTLAAELTHASTSLAQRRSIAMALGHLADASPHHWSARLARAIDYRSATPSLLARPHGVLRLP